jgi:hypothetical protein
MSVTNTFVDGEPIDASKLQSLVTDLNLIKSKIPTFRGSTSEISIDQSTTVSSIGPEIKSGQIDPISVTGDKMTKRFRFPGEPFSKTPIVIICMRGAETSRILSVRVLSNSVSTTEFSYVISAPSSAYTGNTKAQIGINYIAMAY